MIFSKNKEKKKENGRYLRHCYDTILYCYQDILGDGKYPYVIPNLNKVSENFLYYQCFSLENKNYYNISKSEYNQIDPIIFAQSGSDLIKGLKLTS